MKFLFLSCKVRHQLSYNLMEAAARHVDYKLVQVLRHLDVFVSVYNYFEMFFSLVYVDPILISRGSFNGQLFMIILGLF